jgi:hypothetical protein
LSDKKLCVHCGVNLNAGAKVCTQCNRSQSFPRLVRLFEHPVAKVLFIGLFLSIGGAAFQNWSAEQGSRTKQASSFANSMIEIQMLAEALQTPCPLESKDECEKRFADHFTEFGRLAYRFKESAYALLANYESNDHTLAAVDFVDSFNNPSEDYREPVRPLQLQLLASRPILTQTREQAREYWCKAGRSEVKALTDSINTYRYCYGTVRRAIRDLGAVGYLDGLIQDPVDRLTARIRICSGYIHSLKHQLSIKERAKLIHEIISSRDPVASGAPWHSSSFCKPELNQPFQLSLIPEATRQLLVVIADNWQTQNGKLYRWSKHADGWRSEADPVQVNLGSGGLAWGRGIHPFSWDARTECQLDTDLDCGEFAWRVKTEGDKRAPAGIFTLGSAYIKASKQSAPKNFSSQEIEENSFCEDRSISSNYNSAVLLDEEEEADCKMAGRCPEKMDRSDHQYDGLLWVEHNKQRVAQAGSCIFLHIEREEGASTLGCTSMPRATLKSLFDWLDQTHKPLLIQLPAKEYEKYREIWGLPTMPESIDAELPEANAKSPTT